jgi:ATP-dependent Lon protease
MHYARVPGWPHINVLASLRPSSVRNSPLRTIFTTPHPPSLQKTRYYSIVAQGPPSLHCRQHRPLWSSSQLSFTRETHEDKVVRLDNAPDDASSSSAGSSPPPSSSSSDGDNPDSSDPPSPPPSDASSPPPSTSITRQSVPENYPQVLALPIARRPLFPGFYKAVVIRNPKVVAAIKDMMKRGQPYLGAFLLKDEQADSDVITDINSVHPVGVFAQITSVFSATSGPGKEEEKEEGLTAVLYPHRRIRITDLVKAGGPQPSTLPPEHIDPSLPSEQEQVTTPPPSPRATDSELSVEQAKRHPGTPAFHAVVFISAYGYGFFRASADLLPPGT